MEVSGRRCDPLRGAAAELVDCYASCIGAAHTSDGLQLVEEVADQLQLAKRTQCTPTSTAAVKISAAGGLREQGEPAEALHRKAQEVVLM